MTPGSGTQQLLRSSAVVNLRPPAMGAEVSSEGSSRKILKPTLELRYNVRATGLFMGALEGFDLFSCVDRHLCSATPTLHRDVTHAPPYQVGHGRQDVGCPCKRRAVWRTQSKNEWNELSMSDTVTVSKSASLSVVGVVLRRTDWAVTNVW